MISSNQWGKLTSLNPNFVNISLSSNPSSFSFSPELQEYSEYKCEIYEEKQEFLINYLGNGHAVIQIEGQFLKKGEAFKINSGDKIKVILKKEKEDEITAEYIFSSEIRQDQKEALKRNRDEEEEIAVGLIRKQIKEDFESESKCFICQTMIYECVSVSPCLHSFCMDCLMGHLNKSQDCPRCEERCVEFRRNTYLNNLIEGYKESGFKADRSEEECRKIAEKLKTERFFARFEYAEGSAYEGEWKKCKRDGTGKLLDFEGNLIYEGDWKNGLMDGKGKLIFAEGDIYEGDFKEDKMNGQGKMNFENGDVYEGDWKDGCLEGKGKMIFENGDVYEGDWKEDQKEGIGKMEYANGDFYEGEWKEDRKDGWGKIFYKSGSTWEGKFVRNVPDFWDNLE